MCSRHVHVNFFCTHQEFSAVSLSHVRQMPQEVASSADSASAARDSARVSAYARSSRREQPDRCPPSLGAAPRESTPATPPGLPLDVAALVGNFGFAGRTLHRHVRLLRAQLSRRLRDFRPSPDVSGEPLPPPGSSLGRVRCWLGRQWAWAVGMGSGHGRHGRRHHTAHHPVVRRKRRATSCRGSTRSSSIRCRPHAARLIK
jgi:hypothetical protein